MKIYFWPRIFIGDGDPLATSGSTLALLWFVVNRWTNWTTLSHLDMFKSGKEWNRRRWTSREREERREKKKKGEEIVLTHFPIAVLGMSGVAMSSGTV